MRTLLALCDLRAGAAFRLLAPSQMRELATAPDVRLRAIARNRFFRLSFDGWIERGQRDREQGVQRSGSGSRIRNFLLDRTGAGEVASSVDELLNRLGYVGIGEID